jgi:hypothetical protein
MTGDARLTSGTHQEKRAHLDPAGRALSAPAFIPRSARSANTSHIRGDELRQPSGFTSGAAVVPLKGST